MPLAWSGAPAGAITGGEAQRVWRPATVFDSHATSMCDNLILCISDIWAGPWRTTRRGPRGQVRTGEAPCSRGSPRCRNRIAPWASGSMLSSRPARRPSRRGSATGCPLMPRTARSLLLPKRAEVQYEVRDVRLQRQGEPRRRRNVADRLRFDRVDRRRRGKDRALVKKAVS